jgi:hypothetical protein
MIALQHRAHGKRGWRREMGFHALLLLLAWGAIRLHHRGACDIKAQRVISRSFGRSGDMTRALHVMSSAGPGRLSAPLCAWRFVSNGDAFNVALPDKSSIYRELALSCG